MSVHFKEEQRFDSWYIYLIFGVSFLAIIIPIVRNVLYDDRSMPVVAFLSMLVMLTLIATVVFKARLETEIDRYAIKYRFFPFILRWKRIDKSEINKAEVVKYNPLTEYGGYGYRHTFTNGRALNIKGSSGLRINYGKNKKLLIGTQKPDELRSVISNFFNQKEIE